MIVLLVGVDTTMDNPTNRNCVGVMTMINGRTAWVGMFSLLFGKPSKKT